MARSEPLRTLKENLAFYRDSRFNVDVHLTDAEFNRQIAVRDLEELERDLRELKISSLCHLPHHGLHLSCPDPRVMEYSREMITEGLEIGTILGCKIAILRSGFSNHVRPKDIPDWKARLIDSMQELVAQAEDEEIVLALENAYEPDGEVLLEVMQTVNSPWLRFCVDLGKAACFSRMAPEEWIHTFKDWIIALNFHDNEGLEDEHLACGRGVVGYDEVYSALTEERISCNVSVDVAPEDVEPSLEHLREIGFELVTEEIPDVEIFPGVAEAEARLEAQALEAQSRAQESNAPAQTPPDGGGESEGAETRAAAE